MNRDAYVATGLLLVCGVFFWASFDIREPDYGVLPPSTWPRLVIGVLTLLSGIYLVQSLRRGPDDSSEEAPSGPPGFLGWLSRWRNVIYCFILFFLYLLALPYLGMLVAGVSFVFLLQCLLGGWSARKLMFHALVAVLAVGGMWSLFTYGLDVQLPRGELPGLFLR